MGKTHDLSLKAYIELEVRDKNGKLIRKYRQPARSWVKGWLDIIYHSFRNEAINVTEIDGTSSTIQSDEPIGKVLKLEYNAGVDFTGILIGSGTKEYDFNDYSLAQQIPNGSESGQMLYGECIVEEPKDDGSRYYVRVIRTFTNNSGGDITVTEIGLAVYGNGYHTLIARDVLDNPVTVPDGSALTVRYIIQYQYA